MKRRPILLAIGAALCGVTLGAVAQPVPTPKRVGCLWPGTADSPKGPFRLIFESRLRELGWIDGHNLVLVDRFWQSDIGRAEILARELEAEKMDVIHTVFSPAVRAAHKGAPSTPIVFSIVSDPVSAGLVASLARPGGNITGASTREAELYRKRIQLVTELLPRAKRVAALIDSPPTEEVERRVKDLIGTGTQLGLQVEAINVDSAADVGPAFDRMTRGRVDVVLVFLYFRQTPEYRRMVVDQAARTHLPAVYPWAEFVDLGGLMAYSQNPKELARRAANYVDKILRGARPADLPVEEPNAFELVINLRTAKALGITIPQNVLLRADRVIE